MTQQQASVQIPRAVRSRVFQGGGFVKLLPGPIQAILAQRHECLNLQAFDYIANVIEVAGKC